MGLTVYSYPTGYFFYVKKIFKLIYFVLVITISVNILQSDLNGALKVHLYINDNLDFYVNFGSSNNHVWVGFKNLLSNK